MITEKITIEEDNQEAMLEDGITIKLPHVQYCQQLTVVEREVKEAKTWVNKTLANKWMNLASMKGNMGAKSTMNHHQMGCELFVLYPTKREKRVSKKIGYC